MQNFIKNNVVKRVMNAVAAGTTDQTSSAVDTQGFNTCTFIVLLGTLTTGAVTGAKVQQSSDDGASDTYADLEGTAKAIADSDDNKMLVIEVTKPRERYLKCVVTRSTQNAVIDGVLAILSNKGPGKLPVTEDATVAGSELHVSPAEGTA